MKISPEQWELYEKKYGKLMWKIAHRISGDPMTASLEDNYSDLTIAAIESVRGFNKKTGKTFDEMFPLKLFDQYTKTCLWTMKAKKGIGLTERMPFRNKHIYLSATSLDDTGEVLDVPDTSALARYTHLIAKDVYDSFDSQTKKAIKLLETNQDLMTAEGSIKETRLAEAMDISLAKVKKIIERIKRKNGLDK